MTLPRYLFMCRLCHYLYKNKIHLCLMENDIKQSDQALIIYDLRARKQRRKSWKPSGGYRFNKKFFFIKSPFFIEYKDLLLI